MQAPKRERNKKAGASLVAALQARHFDAAYADTVEEALALACAMIPQGAGVGFGGSMTVVESGLLPRLAAQGCVIYDRGSVPPEERTAYMQQHYFTDWYLGSVNAMDEDGVLYNIDGNGNRVAAYIYGPKNVLLLVGMNKVAKDAAAARARARSLAAPTNAQRFGLDTPCSRTGLCADCKSPDCICAYMTAIRLSRPAGRIHVILIGEELGF